MGANVGRPRGKKRGIMSVARNLHREDTPAQAQFLHLVDKDSPLPFATRTAFLLNANARAVTPQLVEKLTEVVPSGDLFFSRSLEDSELFLHTILRRGYAQLFVGGGDGTLVGVLNALAKVTRRSGLKAPRIGVLKLGTGNAISYEMGAGNPFEDANHIVSGGKSRAENLDMVVCDDGTQTPFAGIGYDAAVLNDYIALKENARSALGKRVVETVWGYLGAIMTRSVPRSLREAAPTVRLRSNHDAYRMVSGPDGVREERIPAGETIYEGPAPTVSVGSITYYGYGFTMFPFARRKAGHIQVRVCAVPIFTILANLFPTIWHGRFRHPKLHDFLVRDVVVEGSRPLPYQVGGDAKGFAKSLHFQASATPIEMVALEGQHKVRNAKATWVGRERAPQQV